jgi:HTH-type transcriptional regulator / antitoxin MqsA
MKSADFESCPLCGGELVRENRRVTTSYRGHEQSYEQPGQYCSSCGEAFLHPADLAATAAMRKDFDRAVDRLLTSQEIKEVRARLGLTQRRAGELLGGGPMAFSKYERGLASQSRSTDILLRLLAAGKISIEDIDEVEREGAS